MGLAALVILVYTTCNFIGFVVGYLLPKGLWTPYVPLLVSYHLFLGCLVFYQVYMGEKVGMSLSIPATIFTHLIILAVAFGFVMGRIYVPMYRVLNYAVPGLAFLEINLLFQRTYKKKENRPPDKPTFIPVESSQEHDEFLQYLKGSKREYQRPGRGLSQEFDAWRLGEAKKRAAAAKALAK